MDYTAIRRQYFNTNKKLQHTSQMRLKWAWQIGGAKLLTITGDWELSFAAVAACEVWPSSAGLRSLETASSAEPFVAVAAAIEPAAAAA